LAILKPSPAVTIPLRFAEGSSLNAVRVNVSEPQQHSGPAGKLRGTVGCLERV